MRAPFRNLPYAGPKEAPPPSSQADRDAAWLAAGGKPVPFKILCSTCQLGPVDGAEVFKCDDGSWRCEVH